MTFGGPALAMWWWLRHNWTLQVLTMLASMVVALTVICFLLEATILLLKLLLGLLGIRRLRD